MTPINDDRPAGRGVFGLLSSTVWAVVAILAIVVILLVVLLH